MKKFIIALSIIGLAISLQAASVTVTVLPSTATNVLGNLFGGYAKITSVTLVANPTNTAVVLYDAPTNNWSYTTPAYTNTISYATNYVNSYTNYYGVTTLITNLALVDVANTVAASTNTYPARVGVSALASTTTTINPTAYVFENGVWATNNSSGIATLTVSFVQ